MLKNNIKDFFINNILLFFWALVTLLIEISDYVYYRFSDLKIGEKSIINIREFVSDNLLLKRGELLTTRIDNKILDLVLDNRLKYLALFIIFYLAFLTFVKFIKASNVKLFLLVIIGIFFTAISKFLSMFFTISVLSVPFISLIGFLLIFYKKKILLAFVFLLAFLVSIPYGFKIEVLFPLISSCLFSLLLFEKNDKNIVYVKPSLFSSLFLLVILSLFSILNSTSLLLNLLIVAWSMLGIVIFYILIQILKMYTSVFTNANLMEYVNLDHPLLKKLKEEAPGTYQHSLAMANLVETAANDIGANGLLCRVGAYFHDIGKTLSPEHFTENKQDGESPHNFITPSESAEVIMNHVSYGMELAKKHRLPKIITQFITTHHGTTVLEFFYDKALKSGLDVEPNDFRYPGNKPENKETALLMIVDSVEAASRSLDDPSPDKLESLISNIVFKKLLLNQLNKSGLTISDLRSVILSLLDSLKNNSHSRIKYPWQKKEEEENLTTSKKLKKDILSEENTKEIKDSEEIDSNSDAQE